MKADTLLKKYTFWHDIHNQLSHNIDFSQNSMLEVIEKLIQPTYQNSEDNENLAEYIFKFYAYNELLSGYRDKYNGIIDNDDLTIYSDYQNFANDFSKRIFSFILYSCASEARHSFFIANTSNDRDGDDEYNRAIHKAFCEAEFPKKDTSIFFKEFFEHIAKRWKEQDILDVKQNETLLFEKFSEYLWDYYNIPINLPHDFVTLFNQQYYSSEKKLAECVHHFSKNYRDEIQDIDKFSQFVQFLQTVNLLGNGDNGHLQRNMIKEKIIENSIIKNLTTEEIFEYFSIFFSVHFEHGYGGKPWSDIAQHALSFCRGDINSEIFIDQALSMEHNNGQMFSKNFIFNDSIHYGSYTVIYEKNNFLYKYDSSMSIIQFLLHLQSSSSVLALHQFIDQDFSALTKNFDLKSLKSYHMSLDLEHKDYFSTTFNTFKSFAMSIDSLAPMIKIAQKIDYSIPKFDYANMSLLIAQKKSMEPSYDRNNLINALEEKGNYNYIFSDILNGKYNDKQEHTFLSPEFIKKPHFKLHTLTGNHSRNLSKELLGSKAFGLNELIHKGFNVPKAMVFDTDTCLTYLSKPQFFHKQYKTIQEKINHYLVDDDNNPILVSIRSGSSVSMPGMMDSILNVGIDDSTYLSLCKIHTKKLVNECSISFMTQFCSSKLGLDIQFPKVLHKALDKFTEILIKNDIACDRRSLFPLSKEDQIKLCVEAVFDSWNSPRATAWRNEKKISHTIGTAATIQQMVFGNRNNQSLTCVVFSRDCISGRPDIMGEYLVKSQGEDLVSGKKTPFPIRHLKEHNPSIYQQIEYIAKTLEEEKKAIQDIEITVDNGKVYILQMRNAVVSQEAQLALAKELNLNLLDIVQPKNLIGEAKIDTQLTPHFSGLSGSTGLISGVIVKNIHDIEKYKNANLPLIFFSEQALPEHVPMMIATQACITQFGGATSHAAILARSMGKPCIVGIGKENLNSGAYITIDAVNGYIWEGIIPIVIDQDSAVQLSRKILHDNNIMIDSSTQSHPLILHSWISQLPHINIFKNIPDSKHNLFLNIAQKTALALKMDSIKTIKNPSLKVIS